MKYMIYDILLKKYVCLLVPRGITNTLKRDLV